MSDVVLTSIEDGVMTITLNRPEAKNAVNRALAEAVAAALDEMDANDEVRVGILTGEGGSFCAGMDLKAFVSGEIPSIPGRGFAGLTEASPRKPLIAAVEGYALAGGLELAISCDLIVAAEDSKFGIPEVKRGLVAAAGGLMKLPRQIPKRIAMELALTGNFIAAGRALDLGLVNRITESGGALAGAKKLAAEIAANGPLAVTISKQVVLRSEDWSTEEMFAKQMELTLPVFSSEDAMEGSIAFAEKRAPNWKGK
ncbi:MAG: enoyl-CoA hydratase [Halieaceae bacterium]|jgi:enoyl-CoA hydratase